MKVRKCGLKNERMQNGMRMWTYERQFRESWIKKLMEEKLDKEMKERKVIWRNERKIEWRKKWKKWK